MHLDGRHLEFQNGDLFSCKACEAGYHFAISFALKPVEVSILTIKHLFVCLFVFVALRPMSTAMAIAGRSVHLTTLFLGRLEQAVNQ